MKRENTEELIIEEATGDDLLEVLHLQKNLFHREIDRSLRSSKPRDRTKVDVSN